MNTSPKTILLYAACIYLAIGMAIGIRGLWRMQREQEFWDRLDEDPDMFGLRLRLGNHSYYGLVIAWTFFAALVAWPGAVEVWRKGKKIV